MGPFRNARFTLRRGTIALPSELDWAIKPQALSFFATRLLVGRHSDGSPRLSGHGDQRIISDGFRADAQPQQSGRLQSNGDPHAIRTQVLG